MKHAITDDSSPNGDVICAVCHGCGISMPSECPGEPMTVVQSDRVIAKTLDFKNGFWFNPKYRGFVGTWEALTPGYQFKTTMQRVIGSIWEKQGLWHAQRYSGDTLVYTFDGRREAELYVKAANEESSQIALEARHAS